MKRIQYFCIALVLLSGVFTSCNDMLTEEPKSMLVPSFFKTRQGIEGAVISVYSGLRGSFPSIGTNVGTDICYTSDAVGGWEKAPDTYDALLEPGQGSFGWSFTNINNCNGVLQYGADADMPEARKAVLFAETKFLRAFFYFRLVQSFGDVPLDLGAGKLAFNNVPSTLSVRAPVAEVYDVIIKDLEDAITDLPIRAAQTGRATKKVALHLLSKVYLTRATSKAGQTGDYAKAFQYADELIQNQARYETALMQDYGMIHSEETDDDGKNPECLLRIQYKYGTPFGGSHSTSWVVTAGYENCRVLVTVNGAVTQVPPVPRCVRYQRPWRMYVTTPYLIWEVFANKTTDSRWDNSFRMMWECVVDDERLKSVGLNMGDPGILLYFEGDDISGYPEACVKYKVEDLFDRNGFYKHSGVNYMYPTLFKFDDTKRVTPDESCYRPVIAFRLAETYLIAAEALVMQGKKTEALSYVNTIRKRAAYRPDLSAEALALAEADMTITDPNVLDIDFLLDEHARELYGETPRWYELVRTGKLIERVQAHNPQGAPNIKPHHVLRPVPQSQIDLMTDEEQKRVYQNPGYPGYQ